MVALEQDSFGLIYNSVLCLVMIFCNMYIFVLYTTMLFSVLSCRCVVLQFYFIDVDVVLCLIMLIFNVATLKLKQCFQYLDSDYKEI